MVTCDRGHERLGGDPPTGQVVEVAHGIQKKAASISPARSWRRLSSSYWVDNVSSTLGHWVRNRSTMAAGRPRSVPFA
jgi:hypothetical protein